MKAEKYELYPKKLLKTQLFSALKFGKVVDKKARFCVKWHITDAKKSGKCSKSHLLYVPNVKKGLDNKAQFKLKIA